MKATQSEYIRQKKPLFQKLLNRLLEEYEYVSILVEDSLGKRYVSSKTGTTANEDDLYTQRGYVIKVYKNGEYAEYSGNKLTEDSIEEIASKVEGCLFKLPFGTDVSKYEALKDDAVTMSESTEYKVDPLILGDGKILEKLSSITKKGLAYSDKMLDCRAIADFCKYSKLFLSRNRDMEQNVMYATGYVVGITLKGEEVKSSLRCFSNLGGMEVLDTMEESVEDACRVVIELLDSEPLPPGEYDCICDPTTTGMIVHEAFGHGVEMDMFVKDRALAKDYIGEYVASPLITMHDGNAVDETATYFFDDDGVPASDTIIIDKGILVRGINDSLSAMSLNVPETGNGRRETYARKAYTRMTNTYFAPGKDKLEDMIASVKDGLLLEEPSSGMEDPKNWGIQCMVSIAREIKNGKLTGRVFSPIVLTGYVPDLLKSITMVSDTLDLSGTGFCGKGYKEWVKVSDGGPYIKARIRLG